MEAEQTEKQLVKSIDWAPMLWVILAFASMWATNSFSLSLLVHFAVLEEALAEPLAHLFASLVAYLILSFPVWRDGAESSVSGGDHQLGTMAKKFLIFLAVLIPLSANLLLFLLPSSTDRFGKSILAESQQFQDDILLTYWSLTLLFLLVYVVAAPIIEERFFRQWCWRRMEPRGLSSTIVSTSMFFILIHPVDLVGKIALVPLTALLVFARIKTGGPHFGIWLHGINNLCAIIAGQGLIVWFQ